MSSTALLPGDTHPAVVEVIQFRRAAYRLVRRPASFEDNFAALRELIHRAWRAEMAEWAVCAVLVEAFNYLVTGEVPNPAVSADPVNAALRDLRAKGLSCCLECRRPIPSEETLRALDGLSVAALAAAGLADRAGRGES